MAVGESAGSVLVTIDGDASPLLAKYAQAESASRVAGQRISTALGSGFSSATGLVDQFGSAVQSGVTAPLAEAAPVAQRTALAIRAVGEASRSSVTQIQASSAALRTLEGGTQGSIRAAERFITIIPGIGAALQVAFPLVGLIAFAEIIARVVGKFAGLSDAEKEAEQSNKEFSNSISELKSRLKELDLEEFTAVYGKVAGAFRKSSQVITGDVASDIQKIGRLKAEIADVQAHGAEAQSPGQAVKRAAIQELVPFGSDINRSSGEAAQKQKLIELTHQLDVAEATLAVDRKQGAVDAIGAMKDLSDQDEKAASDQARAAQEAARAAQQAAREQAEAKKQSMEEISRASKSFYSEINRQAREAVAQQKRADEEMSRGMLEGLRQGMPELEAVMSDFFRAVDEDRTRAQRDMQESLRTSGERTQVSDEAGKARLQVEYASQLVHSRSQELAYAESIAQADSQAILDKIASLEVLKQYQSSQMLSDEANKTDLEIEKEKVALLKQQAESESKIAKLKQQQSLGAQGQAQIQGALDPQKLVGQVSQDIGTSIADSLIEKHPGKSIGQELSKTLVQSLRQTAARAIGEVLDGALKIGIAKLGSILHPGSSPGSSPGLPGSTNPATIATQSGAAQSGANQGLVIQRAQEATLEKILTAIQNETCCQANGNKLGQIAASANTANTKLTGIEAGVATLTVIAAVQLVRSFFPSFLASGTSFAEGGPTVVGERGPELVNMPRGAQVIPNHAIRNYGGGSFGVGSAQLTSSMVHNSASQAMSIGAIHLHGVRDMQDVARRLPDVLKARSPVFSPASK